MYRLCTSINATKYIKPPRMRKYVISIIHAHLTMACLHLAHNPVVARLARAIQNATRYRGQAAVRRHLREYEIMKCKHALGETSYFLQISFNVVSFLIAFSAISNLAADEHFLFFNIVTSKLGFSQIRGYYLLNF